jgi:hypothetical protein
MEREAYLAERIPIEIVNFRNLDVRQIEKNNFWEQ